MRLKTKIRRHRKTIEIHPDTATPRRRAPTSDIRLRQGYVIKITARAGKNKLRRFPRSNRIYRRILRLTRRAARPFAAPLKTSSSSKCAARPLPHQAHRTRNSRCAHKNRAHGSARGSRQTVRPATRRIIHPRVFRILMRQNAPQKRPHRQTPQHSGTPAPRQTPPRGCPAPHPAATDRPSLLSPSYDNSTKPLPRRQYSSAPAKCLLPLKSNTVKKIFRCYQKLIYARSILHSKLSHEV